MTFVNYVRTKEEADIHLTITSASTGGGGTEYTLDFRGRGGFADIGYPLRFAVPADATVDERRTQLVAVMRQGLVPFLGRTALADRLAVEFNEPSRTAGVADPWHNWLFSVGADVYATGERSSSSADYCANVVVNRITELAKLQASFTADVDQNRYVLEDTTLATTQRSYDGSAFYAHGLSDHFTLGALTTYSSSRYRNVRHGLSAGPAVEYSILPYSQYTRHEVYVQYQPAVLYRDYYEETLYEKEREALAKHALVLGVTLVRSWGSARATATGSQYLHDLAKNQLSLYASAQLRVAGGLSLTLSGSYAFIHDQLSLRKGGVTEEERLLRLKELATGYSYWVSVGLTYTFGSVYSNTVNPRF